MTVSVPPVLTLNRLSKRFGDVYANRAVSWTLQAGRIYALLGENGAGKSTLMKIMSGYQPADSGTIEIDHQPVEMASPTAAIAAWTIEGVSVFEKRYGRERWRRNSMISSSSSLASSTPLHREISAFR